MKLIIACALSIFFLTGCASILGTRYETVQINTDPAEATVSIKNQQDKLVFIGKSPASVLLKKRMGYFRPARYTVTATKEGNEPSTVMLSSGLSGWYFGNIVFGGLIGILIVDPLTGAMWSIQDDPPALTLNPLPNYQATVPSAQIGGFREEEFTDCPKSSGSATISGLAFTRTLYREVRPGDPQDVLLVPMTSYSREWYESQVLRNKTGVQVDPRFKKYLRTTKTDGYGKFKFEHIPAGSYFVAVPAYWELDGNQYAMKTGSWSGSLINVSGNELEVSLAKQ